MASVIINKGLSAFNQDCFSINQEKLSLIPQPLPYVKPKPTYIKPNIVFDPVFNQVNNQIAYDNLVLSQKESYENSKFTPNYKYNGANTLSFSGLGLKNNYKNQISPGFEALKKQSVSDYSMAKSPDSSSPPSSRLSVSSMSSIKNDDIIGSSINPSDTEYLEELPFSRTTNNIQYNNQYNSSHFFASSVILSAPPNSRRYSTPTKTTPKSPVISPVINSPLIKSPVNLIPQFNRKTIIEHPKKGVKSYTSDKTNMIPPTKKKQIGNDYILNKQTSMTNGYSSASDNSKAVTYTTPAIDAKLNSKKNSFMEVFEKPKTNRRGKNIIDYTISSASSNPGDTSSGSNYSAK